MATRRSRLQIKPNIGPRGAVKLPTRPLASTAATAGNKPGQDTDSADNIINNLLNQAAKKIDRQTYWKSFCRIYIYFDQAKKK